MNGPSARSPRLLVVGGTGGLVGRSVLAEFGSSWQIRSLHRHAVPAEAAAGVEWVPGDAVELRDWGPVLDGVDCVVNLAWYRWERPSRFRELADGLIRLLAALPRDGTVRVLHLSVPPAPERLETGLPYLSEKRRVDRALTESGLSYRILRPTLLFAPRDKLLTVMLGLIARHRRFPMFGDGQYHVSPIAARDLARALRLESASTQNGTVDLGGAERLRYRELTDRIFHALGLPPRYVRMGRRSALALTRLMVAFGSTLLYPYEVEWLTSDLLGLPPYAELDRPLTPVGPFLVDEAASLRAQV